MSISTVASRFWVYVACCLLALSFPANSHDGVVHDNLTEALQHQEETSTNTSDFPEIKGGDYDLVDQYGKRRTSKDPSGRFQLVFFGYASCKAICSVALPTMVATVDLLDERGIQTTPVLITVDPTRDTVETMGEPLAQLHERMIGLTGSEQTLQNTYDAFQVEKELVYTHPEHGEIYSHGTYIYLLDPKGDFQTLLLPVLTPERMAEVVQEYVLEKRS